MKTFFKSVTLFKLRSSKFVSPFKKIFIRSSKNVRSIVPNIDAKSIKRSIKSRKLRPVVIYSIIVLAILLPVLYLVNQRPKESEAAWFDETWQYRKAVTVTNSSGSNLTDFQVSVTLDTASLISANKMRSDCYDLRVVGADGKQLPFWIEEGVTSCNTSGTVIWTKMPSIPTQGAAVYLYYGNSSAAEDIQNPINVFEFFDDFNDGEIDPAKWTVGTIAAATGGDFSESGGYLVGGNNNRYVQSVSTFTGNYIAETRVQTVTDNANGYSTVGFWSSTTNAFGLLDHNNSSYHRNNSTWTNFVYDGTGQWNRDKVKVVSTAANYYRTGETSGSASGSATNTGGISAEYIRVGARQDNSNYNQTFSANWDWILVRKAVATEPSLSAGSEEKSAGPMVYYKMDEGTGFKVNDSSWVKTGTTTNLVSNPSFEEGTTGWTTGVNGGTWSIDPTNCAFGDKCLKGVTSSTSQASVFDVSGLTSGATYTFSAYIRAESGAGRFYVSDNAYAGAVYSSSNSENVWKKVTASKTAPANGILRIVLHSSTTGTQYFDGIQLESGSTSTIYCDADQLGNGSHEAYIGLGTTYVCDAGTDGQFIDAPTWQSGSQCVSGSCIKFDGSNDYIDTGKDYSWSSSDSFTFSFWAKSLTTSANQTVFGKGTTGSTWEYSMKITNAIPNFTYWNTSGAGAISLSSSKGIQADVWNHYEITYDGSNAYMYLNGVMVASNTGISATFQNRTNNLQIGLAYYNSGVQGQFNGLIDEFKIYNYARSEAQVKQDYAAGSNTGGVSATFGNTNQSALNNGLLGYWKMDEATANTCSGGTNDSCDSSGNGNDGAWSGNVANTSGKIGNGTVFDGTSDNLNVGSGINLANASFTVSAWIKRTSAGRNDYIMSQGSGATNVGLHFMFRSTNKFTCAFYGNDLDSAGTYTETGEWHLWTCTYDASTNERNLYRDGLLETSDIASADYQGTGTMYLGSRYDAAAAQGFIGSMDDARIYNRVLSSEEVFDLYNYRYLPSPVVYYDFNENRETLTDPDSVLDKSGNNVNASITNRTGSPEDIWGAGKYGSGFSGSGKARYVEVQDQSAIDLQDNFSISFWIHPQGGFSTDSDRFYGIMDKGSYTVFLDNTNGKLTVETGNGGTTWSKNYDGSTYRADALAVYNDKLYAAKGHSSGAGGGDLYSYDGSTWSLAYDATGSYGLALGYYKGNLYFSTGNDTGNVYSWNGSSATDTTFSNCVATVAQSFQAFNAILYGGAGYFTSASSGGGDVCAYNGSSWSKSYDGLGANEQRVKGLMTYNDHLFAGNYGSDWGDVNEFDGANYTQVYDGDSTYGDNYGMAVWNGYLWFLNGGGSNKATTIKYDPLNGASVVSNGTANDFMMDGVAYNGLLYTSSAGNATGEGDVFSYNGTSWSTAYAGGDCEMNALAVWRGDIYAAQVDCTGGGADGDIYKMEGGDYVTGSKTSWSDDWHHVVITKSGTTLTTYVDGQQDGTGTVASSLPNNTNDLLIGTTYGSRGEGTGDGTFKGGIDEVKIYNYVLSQDDIVSEMNNTYSGTSLEDMPDPMVYYNTDEGNGTTAHNSGYIGSDLDGTIGGATWTNSGKFGKSLSYDGTSDVITAPASNLFDFGTEDFSVTAWIYTNASGSREPIVDFRPNGAGNSLFHIQSNGTLRYQDRPNGGSTTAIITSANTIPATTWTHVALVRRNGVWYIYINGSQDASSTTALSLASGDPRVGYFLDSDTGESFDGKIDEFKVYDVGLNDSQIKTDFNQGKSASLGSLGTASTGVADNSSDREYCIPGDSSTCGAPIGEWKLDENSGSSAYDTSGSGYTGTASGTYSWAPGQTGSSLKFDGSTSYVSMGDVLDMGTSDYSVSLWFKTTDSDGNLISKSKAAAFAGRWYIIFQSGNITTAFDPNATTPVSVSTSSTPYVDGKWHHVVSTFDRDGSLTMYLDGLSVASASISSYSAVDMSTTCLLLIGRYNGSSDCTTIFPSSLNLDGFIDNVRIYNYVRTPAQIRWEYNHSAPVAWYKMDECEGTTIYNSTPTTNDAAASFNGTLTIGGSGSNTTVGTCATSGAWYNGASGKTNASIDFDGTDDYVLLGTGSTLASTGQLSLSAWIKLDNTTGDHYIVSKYRAVSGKRGWALLTTGTKLQFILGTAADGALSFSSTEDLSAGTWYHVAGVIGSDNVMRLFINGKQDSQQNYSGTRQASTCDVNIGAYGDSGLRGSYFAGQLDDVMIHPIALTEKQIQNLQGSGAVRFD